MEYQSNCHLPRNYPVDPQNGQASELTCLSEHSAYEAASLQPQLVAEHGAPVLELAVVLDAAAGPVIAASVAAESEAAARSAVEAWLEVVVVVVEVAVEIVVELVVRIVVAAMTAVMAVTAVAVSEYVAEHC